LIYKYPDDALTHLYKPKAELLICGDINTDYLIKATEKDDQPLY